MMCCSDARNRCAEAPCQSVVLLFGINFAKLISEALAAAVVSKLNLFQPCNGSINFKTTTVLRDQARIKAEGFRGEKNGNYRAKSLLIAH